MQCKVIAIDPDNQPAADAAEIILGHYDVDEEQIQRKVVDEITRQILYGKPRRLDYQPIRRRITMYAEDKFPSTGTMTASELKQRQPQVQAACVELEHVLGEVHKSVAELESRLASVLRSEPTEAAGSQSEARPTMVPLASNIDGYARQLRVVVTSHQSILRRLELP